MTIADGKAVAIGLAAVATMTFVAGSAGLQGQQAQQPPDQAAVAHGKYLVDSGGCHDCHTPKNMGPNGPEPDLSRALSGAPADAKTPAPP